MPSWMSDVNVLELTFFFFPNINNNKELPTWLQELGNCYFIIKKKELLPFGNVLQYPAAQTHKCNEKEIKNFFCTLKN